MPSLPEIKQQAMAVRTTTEALEAPTFRQIVLKHGPGLVGRAVMEIIQEGMEYFSAQRRMPPAQVGLFADQLVQRYPHESMADVGLFMRNAATGTYGRLSGESFGALDPQRMFSWFAEYLEEKAVAREREQDKMEAASQVVGAAVLRDPNVQRLIKSFRADRENDRKTSRLLHLVRHVPNMTIEELREAYVLYPTKDERTIIMGEVQKRGITATSHDQKGS